MGKVVVATQMTKISTKIDRDGNIISETITHPPSSDIKKKQQIENKEEPIIEKKR